MCERERECVSMDHSASASYGLHCQSQGWCDRFLSGREAVTGRPDHVHVVVLPKTRVAEQPKPPGSADFVLKSNLEAVT